MNTKFLMTSSSLILAVVGIFTLFAPDVLLSALGLAVTAQLSVLVQLLGVLYFSFALMNWTPKIAPSAAFTRVPFRWRISVTSFRGRSCWQNIYSPTNSISPFY